MFFTRPCTQATIINSKRVSNQCLQQTFMHYTARHTTASRPDGTSSCRVGVTYRIHEFLQGCPCLLDPRVDLGTLLLGLSHRPVDLHDHIKFQRSDSTPICNSCAMTLHHDSFKGEAVKGISCAPGTGQGRGCAGHGELPPVLGAHPLLRGLYSCRNVSRMKSYNSRTGRELKYCSGRQFMSRDTLNSFNWSNDGTYHSLEVMKRSPRWA